MATELRAESAQKQIQAAAEKARPDTRVIRAIEVGQAIRQGDIYVTRLARPAARATALKATLRSTCPLRATADSQAR
jgi:hypothetical protein